MVTDQRMRLADLTSEELQQINHLAVHTGASVEALLRFRATVLSAAAERIRARCAADKAQFPRHSDGRIGLLSAAQMIDPQGDGRG